MVKKCSKQLKIIYYISNKKNMDIILSMDIVLNMNIKKYKHNFKYEYI